MSPARDSVTKTSITLYPPCPWPFMTFSGDGDILISLDPSAIPNTGITGRGHDFEFNGTRCLGGVPWTEWNTRKGGIWCVVKSQTLGFKFWMRRGGGSTRRECPDPLSPRTIPALKKSIITAQPADWLSPSIWGITRNKNGFNRNGNSCNRFITKSPYRISLPNLLFFNAPSSPSFSPGREWQLLLGADTITSINLPGARCIFITNIIGIQITEQASISHPSTMDQLG